MRQKQSRALIDAIPQQIWSGPADGSIDFCNERWRSYMGLSLEELQGEGWQRMLHPDDRERVLRAWQESVEKGTPYEQEERHRGADGEYLWFLSRGVPVRNAEGQIVRWYGTNTDIEDRKRAEDARRESEERIRRSTEQHIRETRTMIDAIPQQIWSGPAKGSNDFCNERLRSYTGLSLEQFQGEGWLSILHPDDRERVLKAWQDSVAKGTPYEQEERHRGVDGKYRWFLNRGVPVHDEEGHIVRWYGTNTDIEDRKQAEEKLRQLSRRLLRLQDQERRRIAQDLHDSTGQDLVALATMLGQLRASLPSSERKSRKLLSECKALADRCIRDVRTLSYVLHPPVLDQAGLGEAVRDYLKGFSKRSGIEVQLELSPHVGRMPQDVELTLFRVVQESLTNIQRHSGSQHVKIRIDRNSDLTLEISDSHNKASNSAPSRAFPAPFEFGVGIPSMQERVKLVGGRLEINSTGQGTTVRVTLPGVDRENTSHPTG